MVKRKNITKILALLLTLLNIFMLVGCDFGNKVSYGWEYWVYDAKNKECYLGDMTVISEEEERLGGILKTAEKGTNLILPSYIGENKVTRLGYSTMMAPHAWRTSYYRGAIYKDIDNIYLPYTLTLQMDEYSRSYFETWSVQNVLYSCSPAFDIMFLFSERDSKKYDLKNYLYTPASLVDEYQSFNDGVTVLPGNVVYYTNFEGADNEHCFVDNYAYGSTIEIQPLEPYRKGYTFDGWYKERECLNAWDFEKDTLPILSDGEEFKETKLYAKWIKH